MPGRRIAVHIDLGHPGRQPEPGQVREVILQDGRGDPVAGLVDVRLEPDPVDRDPRRLSRPTRPSSASQRSPTGAGRRARALAHASCVIAVATTLLTPLPLRGLVNPGIWATDSGAQQVRLALAHISADADVAADNRLAPQLTARHTVYFFSAYPQADVRPTWVAVSNPPDTTMAAPVTMAAAVDRLPSYGYREALRTNAVVIFHLGDVDRSTTAD